MILFYLISETYARVPMYAMNATHTLLVDEAGHTNASGRRELPNRKACLDRKEEAAIRNGGSIKGRINAY
ncbi:hypothetical protein PISMIDRAFT_676443 [Pisolithus microcarpus 441]|uniref:Uncharacterized protein n=1 Tax=Pisolithus microcarpus 441 TaxID=765257 RepID=A0A0D0A1H7_9AGAM|nr:hypothetical protein PISMIDRAFT_676443 [Pisolithus microcarpus 441]